MSSLAGPPLTMAVALLARSLNYGGAERQIVELARGLARRGHRVAVVVFYSGGSFFADLEGSGVQVVSLQKRGRWDLVSFLPRLIGLLRRLRPQVLYAFMVEPSLIASLLKPLLRGARIVWGVRGSNVNYAQYGWFPKLAFWCSRKIARLADLVVANSWAGAAYHERLGYPSATMAVVPNGIDVQRFRPDPQAGRRQRASWGIPDGVPVVGLVGRLDPMKDHSTFLRAASLVVQRAPETWFVCVGEGRPSYRMMLQRQAELLGVADRVRWIGGHYDMVAAYNAFDVACLCSAFGEGFSNALAEAMACGIPIVATDVGDASRILEGCAGVLPPKDPERLADALSHALAERAPDAAEPYRRRIVEHFSVDQMVAETERLLHACIQSA